MRARKFALGALAAVAICYFAGDISAQEGAQKLQVPPATKVTGTLGRANTTATTERLFHVNSLDIDYEPWKANQRELRAKLDLAEEDIRRAKERLAAADAALEREQAKAKLAFDAERKAQATLEAARDRLVAYRPDEKSKSNAYRKAEQRRDSVQARLDRLFQHVTAEGNPVDAGVEANYRKLVEELDAAEAELRRIGKEIGLDAERDRLAQAASDALLALTRAELEAAGAGAVVARRRAERDKLDTVLVQALERASKADLELSQFSARTARIGGVRIAAGARIHYETTIWDPKELLDYLDREIETLGSVVREAEARRSAARNDFFAAQEEALYRGHELIKGILNSAVAQGVAEFAFNAVDVIEKAAEAGVVGAVGEGIKKGVEALVLGPPKFYDPSIAPTMFADGGGAAQAVGKDLFADIRGTLVDALKYSGKRAAKSALTSPAASVVVKKYIQSRSLDVYREAIGEAIVGTIDTGFRVDRTLGQRAAEAFSAFAKAQEGYKKAIEQALFKNFGKLAGASVKETLKNVVKQPQVGKLGHSVARDLAKMAVKKSLAEWLEGVPLANKMAADAQANMASQLFLAASAVYWEARDPYEARLAERREVLRQYDPKNSMRIVTESGFGSKTHLRIELRDSQGDYVLSASHKVRVVLGGKEAAPIPGTVLTYSIDADGLKDDGQGGVALKVIVEE